MVCCCYAIIHLWAISSWTQICNDLSPSFPPSPYLFPLSSPSLFPLSLSPSPPPFRYIPVAVLGSKDLLKRAKHQQQETKQHQSRLEVSNGSVIFRGTTHGMHYKGEKGGAPPKLCPSHCWLDILTKTITSICVYRNKFYLVFENWQVTLDPLADSFLP